MIDYESCSAFQIDALNLVEKNRSKKRTNTIRLEPKQEAQTNQLKQTKQ